MTFQRKYLLRCLEGESHLQQTTIHKQFGQTYTRKKGAQKSHIPYENLLFTQSHNDAINVMVNHIFNYHIVYILSKYFSLHQLSKTHSSFLTRVSSIPISSTLSDTLNNIE